jgi:hypothetical protein
MKGARSDAKLRCLQELGIGRLMDMKGTEGDKGIRRLSNTEYRRCTCQSMGNAIIAIDRTSHIRRLLPQLTR